MHNTSHHIKGIRPALAFMKSQGYSEEDCLRATGISQNALEHPECGISLQEEFAFYRRLLALTNDPLIGLELGRAYRIENYGVFGYALLSAQTMGDVMQLAAEYGSSLAFSHFKMGFEIKDKLACFHMSKDGPMDPELLQLYSDRDFSAVIAGAEIALEQKVPLKKVCVMHDGSGQREAYRDFFACPVTFGHDRMEMFFDTNMLSVPMPLRDPETSEYCQMQCKMLLQKLQRQSSLVDQVRQQLVGGKMPFPTLPEVAEQLKMSERTLRRNLAAEGHTFQDILNEIRQQLAMDYLDSSLPLKRIADMLGYSEPANFSHAFKKWTGMSPKAYRARHLN